MSGSDKDYEPGSPEAAELWRRFAPGSDPGAEAAPDSLLIAAYVDGALDQPARDRIEAWMAGSPDALDLVIAARAASTDGPPAAPAGLLVRAQGLVRPAAVDTGAKSTIGGWFADMMRPGVWAATAAAMLLAAVVSFELGRAATIDLAATPALTVASADDDGLGFGPSGGDLL